MATQQDTPAMQSSVCTVPADKPSTRGEPAPTNTAAGADASCGCSGGRRRKTSASGRIARKQNTPMPIYVARQPAASMKCCITGGQMAPAT